MILQLLLLIYQLEIKFSFIHSFIHSSFIHSNVIRDKNLNIESTDLFLYGDPSLSTSENQTIICATLDFIDRTDRLAS